MNGSFPTQHDVDQIARDLAKMDSKQIVSVLRGFSGHLRHIAMMLETIAINIPLDEQKEKTNGTE